MKKALLFAGLFTLGSTFAQDCSKIFISEYVEGWSNNKALEIYNPTNQTVDLSNYIVARYSNGATTALVKHAVQLSGTIAPHDVFVAVLDKRDPNGEDQEAPVWDSLQDKADGFFCPVYDNSNAFYWNGDDAIVLLQGTLTSNPDQDLSTITPALVPIDIFGKVGEQPTNPNGGTNPAGGWSTGFPYTGTNGVIVSQDHSLIRKPTVLKGTTNFTLSFFDPLAEYDSIPAVIVRLDENGDTLFGQSGNPILDGNWASLGVHNCQCTPLGIDEPVAEKTQFLLYPNPATDGVFHVIASSGIQSVTVINALGQTIKTVKASGTNVSVSLNDVPGVYLVKVETGNGMITKRIVVK